MIRSVYYFEMGYTTVAPLAFCRFPSAKIHCIYPLKLSDKLMDHV